MCENPMFILIAFAILVFLAVLISSEIDSRRYRKELDKSAKAFQDELLKMAKEVVK